MISSFDFLKEKVSILEAIEMYTDTGTQQCGSDTFELEDESCPFCGHNNCFRIDLKTPPGYYRCFSCEAGGDVIEFVQAFLKLEKPKEALDRLAKDFKIALPKPKQSPQQQVLNAAGEYYCNRLFEDDKTYESLGGLTPLDYQLQVRGHDPDVLRALGVGWSDGSCTHYLDAIGFERDLIKQSGLQSSRHKGDFMPKESFIYPRTVRGQVSAFSFKNMTGLEYQFRKENWLNNVQFYGQDYIDKYDEIVIVEGENDLISVIEGGWTKGVIATIGTLSKDQLEFLAKALPGKTVITAFDADDAGDKYRDRIAALSVNHNIKVDHVKVPVQDNDIDKFIQNGNTFDDAVKQHTIHVMGGVEIQDGITKFDGINVFESEGCYHKVVVKNGETDYLQISNFVMILKHILVINEKRYRVVNVIRVDGLQSGDIMIDAETKVTLRLFKRRIAEFTDGYFYGTEKDLDEMWQHVFAKDGEFLVDIPSEVGRLHGQGWKGCWMFRNCFIDRHGHIHKPDDQGVYWPNGRKSRGIRPQSIFAESALDPSMEGIPELTIFEKDSEYEEAVKFFLDNLIANFGNEAQALTTAGWCMANAFSDPIFNYYKFFPFPFIWGKFGGGKTGILKILASIYNMDEYGVTTVGSLKSGVGFERKMAYYCSLPLAIDEVRGDRDTRDNYSNFRKWFNREGRSLGARDDAQKVQQRDVKSTIMFGGEEIIEESATRSRLIPIRLARMDDESRETVHTYSRFREAIEGGVMSAIGLHWIRQACQTDLGEMFSQMADIRNELKVKCEGVSTRTLDIYSIVGYFGKYLSALHDPDFDYMTALSEIVEEDKEDQDTSDVVAKFFDILDGLIASEEHGLNGHHVFQKEGKLYIWFSDVFRITTKYLRDVSDGNTITANAIRKALNEEAYYEGTEKVDVGMGNKLRRRCMILNLDKAPESVNNIAEASRHLRQS